MPSGTERGIGHLVDRDRFELCERSSASDFYDGYPLALFQEQHWMCKDRREKKVARVAAARPR